MKIGILRRDGKDITVGMSESISGIVEEYFGKKELFICKDEEEPTQMITFSLSININSIIITHFISKISKVNPLYAVRILLD